MIHRIFKTFSVFALALLLITACSKKEENKASPAPKPAAQQPSPQLRTIEEQKQRIRDASPTGRIQVQQSDAPATTSSQNTNANVLPAPIPGPVRTQTVFVCTDGTYFLAQFKASSVDITYEKQKAFSMQQQHVASGFHYFNRYYDMRGKGRYATWTVGKRPAVTCEAQQ